MTKHGHHGTKEYWAFRQARNRCTNPSLISYKNYGGRGIEFRFDSFGQWYAALGPAPTPEHTVDRIDNDGHYEPGNVRWATREEQSKNQRCPCPNCGLQRGHRKAEQFIYPDLGYAEFREGLDPGYGMSII